jgi:O-antigen ligase
MPRIARGLADEFACHVLTARVTSSQLFYWVTFAFFLLSGTDRWSLSWGFGNIRIVILLLLVVTPLYLLFARFIRVRLTIWLPAMLFLFLGLVSLFGAPDIGHGLLYWLWASATIFLAYMSFCSSVSIGRLKIVSIILNVGGIIAGATLLSFVVGNVFGIHLLNMGSIHAGIYRPHLWFFEPSYLATFLIFPLTTALFVTVFEKKRKTQWYLWILLLGMLATTASAGYVGVGAAVVLLLVWCIFVTRRRINGVISTLLLVAIGFGVLNYAFPKVVDIFLGRLFIDFLGATGERYQKYEIAISVFFQYPILGVGLGNYENYFGNISEWPPNVILEMLATMGILGSIALLWIFLFLPLFGVRSSISKGGGVVDVYLFAVSNAFAVTLLVLQANQNFLRPYVWIAGSFLLALIHLREKQVRPKNTSTQRMDSIYPAKEGINR